MSGDSSLFDEITPASNSISVKFDDGKLLNVRGFGQVVTPLGRLRAMYVPNLCANLLSVHQLNKIGAGISFLPEGAEIRFQGKRYPVSSFNNIFQLDEVLASFYSIYHELDVWHQRMGHLNFPTVISFLKRFGMTFEKPQSPFCKICIQAKQPEKKFMRRDSYSKKPLERVHSDIGGPIDKSYEGYQYWITFIDEHSC